MKQRFDVPDIHCSSCVMLLEELEDEVVGVRNVKVDLRHKIAEIEYDEDRLSQEDLIDAIEQVSGYKASVHAS